MMGERIKEIRNKRRLSLEELGKKVNKSAATISRYENNQVSKQDTHLMSRIANELETSLAFLMGMTDVPSPHLDIAVDFYSPKEDLKSILVTDEDMSPGIPDGSVVNIRQVEPNEKLQMGSYYYIEFNGRKCFRMAFDDKIDGLGFIPNDMSERRIAYDPDYVDIIGKAVSMKVVFEDCVEYE